MDQYKIKQLSVFIENKQGELNDITALLSKNKISLKAINLVDTSEFGILRILVDDVETTKRILDSNGFSLTITEVFAVEIDDHIGSFNEVLELLSGSGINLEYTYTINNGEHGAFIFKVKADVFDKAITLLNSSSFKLLTEV